MNGWREPSGQPDGLLPPHNLVWRTLEDASVGAGRNDLEYIPGRLLELSDAASRGDVRVRCSSLSPSTGPGQSQPAEVQTFAPAMANQRM
jgi:hypothetical protein